MINGLTNRQFVLQLLLDKKPHFSREFVRGKNGEDLLLDYRKRISELRDEGYIINPLKIENRPAYQLVGRHEVQHDFLAA